MVCPSSKRSTSLKELLNNGEEEKAGLTVAVAVEIVADSIAAAAVEIVVDSTGVTVADVLSNQLPTSHRSRIKCHAS